MDTRKNFQMQNDIQASEKGDSFVCKVELCRTYSK